MSGVWGTVGRLDADDDVIAFMLASFSTKSPYAEVPYAVAGEGTPAKGDRAFLHYSTDGQPAYAVVWSS